MQLVAIQTMPWITTVHVQTVILAGIVHTVPSALNQGPSKSIDLAYPPTPEICT